jgi:hypothetical protein
VGVEPTKPLPELTVLQTVGLDHLPSSSVAPNLSERTLWMRVRHPRKTQPNQNTFPKNRGFLRAQAGATLLCNSGLCAARNESEPKDSVSLEKFAAIVKDCGTVERQGKGQKGSPSGPSGGVPFNRTWERGQIAAPDAPFPYARGSCN